MSKQDSLKIQTCILKVSIHCEGCAHKVKKLLQKIEGVYSVNIDAEQGKVLVSGNVDPGKLIKKLKSSGKQAELWAGQRGMMFPTNQFKNLQIDPHGKGGKDNKSHKGGGKDQHKGSGQAQLPQFQNKPSKDHKSVKFNLPEDDFDAGDDDFDDYDEFDDDYDDDEEDDYEEHSHGHPMPNKMMNGHKGNSGGMINAKKGDVMDLGMQMKGKGGNKESKNGNGGKKSNGEGGKKNKGGGGGGNKKKTKSSSGGLLSRFLGFGQKGGDKNKNKNKGGGGGGGNKKGKEGKKGGGKFEDHDMNYSNDDLDEFHIPQPHHGKGGKGGKGSNGNGKGDGNGKAGHVGPNPMGHMGPMEQMRYMAAVQGLPAMNGGGYYQGMHMQPPPPQYNPHQQYMPMMMHHNQPHPNSMYPPPHMMYDRPYMPPPPPVPVHPDHVTDAFSDENTEACTIM